MTIQNGKACCLSKQYIICLLSFAQKYLNAAKDYQDFKVFLAPSLIENQKPFNQFYYHKTLSIRRGEDCTVVYIYSFCIQSTQYCYSRNHNKMQQSNQLVFLQVQDCSTAIMGNHENVTICIPIHTHTFFLHACLNNVSCLESQSNVLRLFEMQMR